MCFLACLTAGGVYMVNQSAASWLRNIASEVTVQVEPADDIQGTDALVNRVADFLSRQTGVASARPLSAAESNALLEPWLGQTDVLNTLPVPRLFPQHKHTVYRACAGPGVMLGLSAPAEAAA